MRASRLALAALLASAPAWADAIVLVDGRTLEHPTIERTGGAYVVKFQNGDVSIPEAHVRAYYKQAEDGAFVPATDEEKEKAARGLVPWEGKWVTASVRARLAKEADDARRLRVEQMKERRHWRNHVTVETRQFTFKHTLPDDVFEEYRALFEAYYDYFTKFWGVRPSADYGKAVINIYHDREYFAQVGGVGGGVVGYYMPKNRDLNFYVDRENRAFTIDVMFHEGNHMLSHMIDEKFWYPWWVGEGMAEYFGASEWNPETKEMRVGLLQGGRLAVLKEQFEDPAKRLKLDTLVTSPGLDAIGYSWAWSFCHYLMSEPRYEKKFKKFFLDLARANGVRRVPRGMGFVTVEGDEVRSMLLKALRVKDIETLEKEWYEYIEKVLTLDRGAEVDWGTAGHLMSLYGLHDKARLYFKRAIDAGNRDPFVLYGYAELKLMQGMPGVATKYATMATEVDPLHARAWCLRGQALAREGNVEEGKRLIQLAQEIDPDDTQIWFALTSLPE